MREQFQTELDNLKERVSDMARLARWMLVEGVDALVELDMDKAQDVLAKKDELADQDESIERDALFLVAKQQPMASDMRAIGAALKLITYINRVGRYGKDIAQIATQWETGDHKARLVQIPQMAERVVDMMDMTMESYRSETGIDIDALVDLEEDVDAQRWAVFRECLTYMAEDPANIEPFSYYMLIARYLERCGDNVCKMAEKTQYMVTGERVTIR